MLYVIYFSPTGGTKKVADILAETWEEKEYIDLARKNFDCGSILFSAEDTCLFALPSFSGRIPKFVPDKIRAMKGNGAKAILAAVYGNRAIDDTLVEMEDLVVEAGFVCAAGISAVAQHSIAPCYGAGRPDAADAAELREFALRCKEASGPVAMPGNRPYRAGGGPGNPIHVDENCISCKLCAKRCPTDAISMEDVKITDREKCITCLQCVAVCPKHARHLDEGVQAAVTEKLAAACSGRKSNELFL